MLADLTRDDWLKALDLPSEWAPRALWLRGTRNLSSQAADHRRHFQELAPLTVPNGVFEDFFIGRMSGAPVAYASVYGSPMASELTHLAGVLGARLVLLTGCCGLLDESYQVGDLLVATEAQCGEGTSQLYLPGTTSLKARIYGRDMTPKEGGQLRFATVHTTGGLLAETRQHLLDWRQDGAAAVDMQAAAVYAVAEKFGMDRVAVLYGFDHPLREQHLLLQGTEAQLARSQGNAKMTGLALTILKDYLKASA